MRVVMSAYATAGRPYVSARQIEVWGMERDSRQDAEVAVSIHLSFFGSVGPASRIPSWH
jgi:hypothetical protein